MELTTKQVHQVIHNVLPFFVTESSAKELALMTIRQIGLVNQSATNQHERVLSIMEENELIHLWSKDSYEITEFGKQVLENGGWFKHLEEIEYEQNLDREIKELTVQQLKKNIFQIKYWWWFLLCAAIAGGLFGELFDLIFSKIGE